MDAVLRTAAIYLVLLVIGEATQQALLGEDFSVVNAVLVIVSLIAIDVALSLLKRQSKRLSRMLDGEPIIIVEHGEVLRRRLYLARVEEADILEAARSSQGLERIDQIKFAILEKNGSISVIPKAEG